MKPNPEPTLIEIPVILTEVEACYIDEQGIWVKFECLSDYLLLGHRYNVGQRVQITITELGYEDYKIRLARQSKRDRG